MVSRSPLKLNAQRRDERGAMKLDLDLGAINQRAGGSSTWNFKPKTVRVSPPKSSPELNRLGGSQAPRLEAGLIPSVAEPVAQAVAVHLLASRLPG